MRTEQMRAPLTGDVVVEVLQELLDERDITATLDQYCYSSDFNDVDGLLDCFAEDGEWWSAIGFTLRGRAEIREFLEGTRNPQHDFADGPEQGRRFGQHFRTNTQITVRGDEADVISYFVQTCPNGPKVVVMAMGRYLQHLVRGEDRIWRFKLHRVEVESHDTERHLPLGRRPDSATLRDDPNPVISR